MLVNLHNFLSIQEEKLVKSKRKDDDTFYCTFMVLPNSKMKSEKNGSFFKCWVQTFVPLQVVIGFRPKFAKPLSHDTGRARCQNIVASSARHF